MTELRAEIDRIDGALVRLFAERMQTAGKIAEYKRQNGLPIRDAEREKEKLTAVTAAASPEYREAAEKLYSTIFELSREYQQALLRAEG